MEEKNRRNIGLIAIIAYVSLFFIVKQLNSGNDRIQFNFFGIYYRSTYQQYMHYMFSGIYILCLYLKGFKSDIKSKLIGKIRPEKKDFYTVVIALIVVMIIRVLSAYIMGLDKEILNIRNVINMTVYGPVMEEIIFRGIMLSIMLESIDSKGILYNIIIVVASSLLFLSVHNLYSIGASVVMFSAGVILSIIYIKTRSIIMCVIVHSFWNFLSFIL